MTATDPERPPRKKSIMVGDLGLSNEMELVRQDLGLTTMYLDGCITDFKGFCGFARLGASEWLERLGG